MIRKAEPRDLEAVNDLLRQVLAQHHAGTAFYEAMGMAPQYLSMELLCE